MGKHRRFFIEPEHISGNIATLQGDKARQISRVLRLREGDEIRMLDGAGREHCARIVSLSRDEVKAEIHACERCDGEPGVAVTLAVCLPKSDKLELIVQKCTELGISEYVVVDSARTVARPGSASIAGKLERWRRIAREAAEQSERGIAPGIRGVLPFCEVAATASEFDLAIVAWEEESETTLREVLRTNVGAKSVLLIIGPEGGLTEEEVDMAKDAGAVSVSLGRRVLRAETAAIATSAIVMYELDGQEFGGARGNPN